MFVNFIVVFVYGVFFDGMSWFLVVMRLLGSGVDVWVFVIFN